MQRQSADRLVQAGCRASPPTSVSRCIPWVPTGAKRLLSGGRSVTIDGNTLDPTLQLMLSGHARVRASNGLVAGRRRRRLAGSDARDASGFAGPQIHVGVNDLSIPGPAGPIPARHYRPATSAPAPLLVFYHGGGWTIGDLDTHDALCRLTCRDADVHVLSVDYRLAPEHPAPAAVDDAYAAFQWACEHAGDLGAIPGKVAVGGDSAGGNLAAVVSQLARDEGQPRAQPVLQWLHLPAHRLHRQDQVAEPVRRGFLAHQSRHGLVRGAVPGRFGGRRRPIRGCRRCWPTRCPGCRPR